MNILSSVALGWLGRRVPEVGGLIAGVVGFAFAVYSQLDPSTQAELGAALQQLVSGQWREITLGHVATVIGIVVYAWSQRKSFKATVTPQIVTPQGEKVELDRLPPAAQADVTITARQAPRRRTLADLLAEKLGRR